MNPILEHEIVHKNRPANAPKTAAVSKTVNVAKRLIVAEIKAGIQPHSLPRYRPTAIRI